MTGDNILQEVKDNFTAGQARKFLPGLLLSFVWLLKDLDAANGKFSSLAELYEAHPRCLTVKGGKPATTLILKRSNKSGEKKTLSVRQKYTLAEKLFRDDERRFDYPSMAPHATGLWPEYKHWLEGLLALSTEDLDNLADATKAFVLDTLPHHPVGAAAVAKGEPPRFYQFLQDFDFAARPGEKTGASYQATAYGYIRADAAHLFIDADKVRSGSKRNGRIGDIEGREGEALVLAAEVKHRTLNVDNVHEFTEFAAQVKSQNALGLVIALGFETGTRESLAAIGLASVSRSELIERVRLWDTSKQRTATQALIYFLNYIERDSTLYARVKEFFQAVDSAHDAAWSAQQTSGMDEDESDEGVLSTD